MESSVKCDKLNTSKNVMWIPLEYVVILLESAVKCDKLNTSKNVRWIPIEYEVIPIESYYILIESSVK